MQNTIAPAELASGPSHEPAERSNRSERRDAVRSLLSHWRAAERRLASAAPGTTDWFAAHEEFEAARRAYLEEMQPAGS